MYHVLFLNFVQTFGVYQDAEDYAKALNESQGYSVAVVAYDRLGNDFYATRTLLEIPSKLV